MGPTRRSGGRPGHATPPTGRVTPPRKIRTAHDLSGQPRDGDRAARPKAKHRTGEVPVPAAAGEMSRYRHRGTRGLTPKRDRPRDGSRDQRGVAGERRRGKEPRERRRGDSCPTRAKNARRTRSTGRLRTARTLSRTPRRGRRRRRRKPRRQRRRPPTVTDTRWEHRRRRQPEGVWNANPGRLSPSGGDTFGTCF